jgi:hypothetical protein
MEEEDRDDEESDEEEDEEEDVEEPQLIESIEELEDLAERLGATNPNLEGMARSLFDGQSALGTVVSDGTARASDGSDPWMAGVSDTEHHLIDHMLELFSSQPQLDPRVASATMPKVSFDVKEYGE